MAVNLERKQKGEQFHVVDPAVAPERPSHPDMLKLFLMVVAAGLGIGGGIIFLLEFFDQSFACRTRPRGFWGFRVWAPYRPYFRARTRPARW